MLAMPGILLMLFLGGLQFPSNQRATGLASASPAPYQIVEGEYKSLSMVGDKIKAEYEHLFPDGTIERHEAYGNPNTGLTYRDFKIDSEGNIMELSAPDQPRLEKQSYGGESSIKKWKDDNQRPRHGLADMTSMKKSLKHIIRDFFKWD